MYVFLILDEHLKEEENSKSITKMSSVKQVSDETGNVDFEIKPYLEDFPFNHFVVLEKSYDLPEVMNEILIKWMNMRVDS